MKRFSIVLMMLACVAMAAFGSGSSESASSDGVVEIEFFSLKPEAVDCYQELVDEFNAANPDINVTLTSTADAQTVFLTRVATNTVPECCYVFFNATYEEFFREGLFIDLTDDPLLDLVQPSIAEMAEVDGRNYSIPVTLSPSGIYYNKDMFAEHGWTMPDTYEGLIELCKEMEAAGIQPFAFSDKDAHTIGQQAERLINGNINVDVISKFEAVGAGETSWTKEPEMRELAEMLLELREYGPADNLGMSHEQAIAEFVNGKVAMIISGTWAATTINQANVTFDYEMLPFPSYDGRPVYLSTCPDTCYAISASASPEKQEASRRFLEFLLSSEALGKWLQTDLSPNMAVNADYGVECFSVINDMLSEGAMVMLPSVLQPAGFRVDWQVAVQQLFIDHDIDAFLAKSDELTVDYYN